MNQKTWTCFSRNLLLTNLLNLPLPKPNETAILLITNNFKFHEIHDFHQSIIDICPRLIGGVVDSIGASPGFSISYVTGTPFHILGKDSFKTVGRIYSSPRQTDSDHYPFKSISQPFDSKLTLPPAKSYFSITDSLGSDIHRSMGTSHLGIVASQTPFTTNLPYTLFHNSTITSKGTVGVGLKEKSKLITENNLYPISDTLKVTKSRGNVIVSLDDLPSTTVLLNSVRGDQEKTKNTELYVKIVDGDREAVLGVLGGDKALAVETRSDIKPGVKIQFMRRRDGFCQTSTTGVMALEEGFEQSDYEGVEEGQFGVGSLGGVYYGGKEVLDGSQFCKIPGTVFKLHLG